MSDPFSEYLDDFARRVLQDAMTEATAAYWLRRAAELEAARPRPGDFNGNATEAELAARDRRLANDAEGCRQRARLLTEDRYDDAA